MLADHDFVEEALDDLVMYEDITEQDAKDFSDSDVEKVISMSCFDEKEWIEQNDPCFHDDTDSALTIHLLTEVYDAIVSIVRRRNSYS